MCDRFEDALVIRTIARHHIYKDILHPPLERHSRAEKNPTVTKIVLLWLLSKTILNVSYYLWICASNHFSTVRFVFEERRHTNLLATHWGQQYSQTINWLRCRLSFALLRCAIMCIRGSRSSTHRPVLGPLDLSVVLAESRLTN